jgi:photosystem II stability/assembly factor-like uncharacterized protein
MSESTRRGFLTLAGVGAAVGVTAIAAPAYAATPAEDTTLPKDAEGSMAAYIHDVTKGEVALMIDGHEVVVTDKPLVARLARAFAKAQLASAR